MISSILYLRPTSVPICPAHLPLWENMGLENSFPLCDRPKEIFLSYIFKRKHEIHGLHALFMNQYIKTINISFSLK